MKQMTIGYVIAYDKGKKTWYLCFDGNKVYRDDMIIMADRFDTKEEALEKIKSLNDDRLYVAPFIMEVTEGV